MADIRDFISCLKHSRGEFAGKPFELFPWQQDYLDKLFNTKRENGTRQYRTCFLAIPRKNGKTQLSAACGLYGLFADQEPGAEIICVAGDTQQASIMFDAAKQMVEGNPTLSSMCKIYRRSITIPQTNSVMKVISSTAGSKHGYNASMILFDEFHVIDRELHDVLVTSTGSRRQPLTILVTTAGFDRQSICYQTWQYAEKVRDGVIKDDTFLPMIYSAPSESDPFDENTWKEANPNFEITIKKEYFEKMANEARNSAAKELTFRRLHLNQWTQSESKWLRHGAWDKCAGELRPPGDRPTYCGLDLGSTFDTTAFAAVTPDSDGTFDLEVMFWIPEENAAQREKEKVPYSQWVKDGFVRLTEGDVCDYDAVRDWILNFCASRWVKGICVDRWNAVHLMTQLTAEGVSVHPFGQGYGPMNAPTRLLENLVSSQKIRHGGNPALAWHASNVQLKTNEEGLCKPYKKHSHDVGRIDGIVASIMAIALASGESNTDYTEPEIMVI